MPQSVPAVRRAARPSMNPAEWEQRIDVQKYADLSIVREAAQRLK